MHHVDGRTVWGKARGQYFDGVDGSWHDIDGKLVSRIPLKKI